MSASSPARPPTPRPVLGLAALFGTLYFVQGICEPSEGLIAQPVRSLLRDWDVPLVEITGLMAVLSLPWSIKPLYGLVADFVPLGRSRRRNWLIAGTLTSTLGLGWLWLHPPAVGDVASLRWGLLIPTVAIAFTDVVADSLMIEKGQPLGLTGRLQSAQWACLWAAGILTGLTGGWLSEHKLQVVGFGICAGASALSLLLALTCVREPARPEGEVGPRARLAAMLRALRDGRFLAVAGFLFLWCFNPFSSAILQDYQVIHLQLGDTAHGLSLTISAVGSVIACIAYGAYSPYVAVNRLIHLSILAGIATTLLYLAVSDESSAYVVAAVTGFTYMTGTLVQLDLAARVCPPAVAGTIFALLMSLSNLGVAGGQWLGGQIHATLEPTLGPHVVFDLLVIMGATASALCWLLFPWLRHSPEVAEEASRDSGTFE